MSVDLAIRRAASSIADPRHVRLQEAHWWCSKGESMLDRLARGVGGRLYEAALRLGLVSYRRPFQYYSVDVWNEGYARGEHEHYAGIADRPRYAALAGYLGVLDGKLSILDVGTGAGVMRQRIPDDKISSYLGTDTSKSGIERGASRGHPNTEFRVGGLPDSGQFDVVICNEMLMLVEDLDGFLDQAKRLLRSGGLFITSNTRYHGDFVLRQKIAARFRQLDEAVILNKQHRRKWRVGCYVNE